MDIVNSIFKDLQFTRVDSKAGYYVYAAGISSGGLAISGNRYVFVYVPVYIDCPIKGGIYSLPWVCVSTRLLNDSYPMKKQEFKCNISVSRDPHCHLVERTKTSTIYIQSENNLEITLLHDPKKKSIYQYHNKVHLSYAIETYNCIIKLR